MNEPDAVLNYLRALEEFQAASTLYRNALLRVAGALERVPGQVIDPWKEPASYAVELLAWKDLNEAEAGLDAARAVAGMTAGKLAEARFEAKIDMAKAAQPQGTP